MTDPLRSAPGGFRSRIITSIEEFRQAARLWDNLWDRSETVVPTARAHPVAHWVEHFRPEALFRAVVVEGEGGLVAGLPLAGPRPWKGLPIGRLTTNVWASNGDLLLDRDVEPDKVLDLVVEGMAGLPWSSFTFERIAYDQLRWRLLLEALRRAGLAPAVLHQHDCGVVEIADAWAAYFGGRKGRHRTRHRRRTKMLDEAGRVETKICTGGGGEDLDAMVARGFEVEHHSWKAQNGTSVLSSPGMLRFYTRQARLLAEAGYLECVFLELNERPIGFLYGWRSKGVHACVKIGYDATCSRFAPGQQLVARLLEHLRAEGEVRFDFYGPLRDWSAIWTTRIYPVGRMLATKPRSMSRFIGGLYLRARPHIRAIRQRLRRSPAK